MIGASRSELLEWINTAFNLNYTKIEQCGNGAIYCQIFDSIFQDVNMSKVNFNPSAEYQIMNNYKILQAGFNKHRISREVPVDRLMKCRLQDNLEFLQWMSKMWSENRADDYDPDSRRRGTIAQGAPNNTSSVRRTSAQQNSASYSNSGSRRTSLTNNTNIVNTSSANPLAGHKVRSSNSSSFAQGKTQRLPSAGGGRSSMAQNENYYQELQTLTENNQQLTKQLDELQIVSSSLETERNFYFDRLRNIEVVIQALTDRISAAGGQSPDKNYGVTVQELVQQIEGILYAPQEGFTVEEAAMQTDDNMAQIHPSEAIANPSQTFDDAETF